MRPIQSESLRLFIDKSEREQYIEELMDVIFTAPIGRAVVTEIPEYEMMFILRRIDVLSEEGLFENYRNTILLDLKRPEWEEDMAARAAQISVEENRAAIRSYRPARLTFDF